MNIAIVIGVSKYLNPVDNLPGSKNDAESINTILQKTEKFSDILYINGDENSAETKALIINFISRYKGKFIDEFFYYYSGHGEFIDDEFYYILSDFDAKKRHQTSLQNIEVDDLIKTLSPSIVVKIIDACQSGAFYIKDVGVLKKYFSENQKRFQKCYFLNSSLNSQSSYADDKISFFTSSFINAIREHKTDEIRYKDIIDVIADSFSENKEQTPLFIIQADLTEKFCVINPDLKEYLIEENVSNELLEEESQNSILNLIKLDAKNYVSKEGAISILHAVKDRFESFKLKQPLDDLYDIEIKFLDNHNGIQKLGVVKNWLDENSNEYFVTPIYEEYFEEYVGLVNDLVGFDLNIEVPFKSIVINSFARYPNILSYYSKILYFISKKSIRFFYYTTNYIEKNWDEKQLNHKDIKWFMSEYNIGIESKVIKGVDSLLKGVQSIIEKEINESFKKEEIDDDDLPF